MKISELACLLEELRAVNIRVSELPSRESVNKDIRHIESEIGCSLPSTYKKFLRRYSGTPLHFERMVEFDCENSDTGQLYVELIYGLEGSEEISAMESVIYDQETFERIPKAFLRIAGGTGIEICLGVRKDVYGQVFAIDSDGSYVDIDFNSKFYGDDFVDEISLHKVADSFDSFIEMLQRFE